MTHTVPDGYMVKGTSTWHADESKWVKTTVDHERYKAMIDSAFDAMAGDLPRLKPVKAPEHALADLVNVLTLTDCHIGMRASNREGDDWDLDIAERTIVGAFTQMIQVAPKAETCVIAQLGDFLHYDSLVAETPTSRHSLDADMRAEDMIDAAVRVLRRVIDLALKKHKKVVLLVAEGNHDMFSSRWLRKMMKALYENEPRLEVIDQALPYYAYKFGKTALFWHHSHLKKFEQLPLIFATEFRKIWGDAEFCYGHTGDKHHKMEKEFSGIIMTQHPTLAGKDAWAARNGYHSLRNATVITYSGTTGKAVEHTINPDILF
jgi:hypothetical protein